MDNSGQSDGELAAATDYVANAAQHEERAREMIRRAETDAERARAGTNGQDIMNAELNLNDAYNGLNHHFFLLRLAGLELRVAALERANGDSAPSAGNGQPN